MIENLIHQNDCPGHIINKKTTIDNGVMTDFEYCALCLYVEGKIHLDHER